MAQPAAAPRNDVKTAIARLSLFQGLEDAVLDRFVEKAVPKLHHKGKLLFQQDDEAEWFYLVQTGWVKLFRETLEGEEAIVDILPAGHIFGETAVFEDGQYPYSAEVVEPGCIVGLPTSLLKKEIEYNPAISLNLLSAMSRHRRQQSREIEHLSIQSAPQRIGCFLLRLCKPDHTGPITLHLPYDKLLIAARLGMRSETFSRALSKLKTEVGLTVQGSSITCHDFTKLQKYACSACSDEYPCQDLC